MRKTAAVVVVALATALGGMAGTVFPSGPHALAAGSSPSVSGTTILQTAVTYLGRPYTATGTNPKTGFSDLGFVRYVYRENGIRLHIHVWQGAYRQLLRDGPRIAMADLQPGDLVYFKNTVQPGLSHVGIYVGNGKFVQAEWYGYGVTVTSFQNDPRDGNYWATHYATANRPWASS